MSLLLSASRLQQARHGSHARSGWWKADLEDGLSTPTEWGGDPGGPLDYGEYGAGKDNEINSYSAFGVPAPPNGSTRVLRFKHLAAVLNAGVNASQTSWVVQSGQGARYPASGFRVQCEDEKVLCTSRTGDTLTVTRAQEGTTGASHSGGLYIFDPAIHHKLYRTFYASTWPSATGTVVEGAPADVSGRYICDFYIDTTLDLPAGGCQLMQFKEEYWTGSPTTLHSDALWGLDIDHWIDNPADINMFMGGGDTFNAAQWDADPYLNTWFTLELRVYQFSRIEAWVNGVLKGTMNSNSGAAAGRNYFPPGSPQLANTGTRSVDPYNGGGNVTSSLSYIFGAGNYTSKQSVVYMDNSRLLPLSTI